VEKYSPQTHVRFLSFFKIQSSNLSRMRDYILYKIELMLGAQFDGNVRPFPVATITAIIPELQTLSNVSITPATLRKNMTLVSKDIVAMINYFDL